MNEFSFRFEPNIEGAIFFLSAISVLITSSWLFAFVSFFTSLSIWRVFSSTWTVVGKVFTITITIALDMAQGYKVTFLQPPRLKKEFAASRHQPFDKTTDYVGCIKNADSEKISKLVRVVGMLLQTKACLFWTID